MSGTTRPDDHPPTILIVDDTPANLGVAAEHLEQVGYRVLVALDGEEALGRAERMRPDIILLDVLMPGLNGFETCRRLKAAEGTRDIPVIFMTSLSDATDKLAGFEAGGVDFVTKPVQLQEVVARTRVHLALREAQKQLEAKNAQLQRTQARLVDTAREVGMTEIASNVLHNVGNVLTSAVINLEMMQKAVGSSRIGRLKQATSLLQEHRERLADFLTRDSHGSHLPDYLSALADELVREQTRLVDDLDAMGRHIEHIRAIVQVQQRYAKTALMEEECDLAQLIDDALRIQMAALQRHGVSVRRELSAVPRVKVDKHKVLQILINLISNAKHALDGVPEGKRNLYVRLMAEEKLAQIQVVDEGVGIAPEMREKLFTHGFTTRKDGHGFGLHTSALEAQLLGGRLMLESEGPGKGATAMLVLPLA
jgi:DNA-binding response OmpR family regulator